MSRKQAINRANPPRTVGAGVTAVDVDDDMIVADASGGAVTLNLPPADAFFPNLIVIKTTDATSNTITVNTQGGELIDGSGASRVFNADRGFLVLKPDGLAGWRIAGQQGVANQNTFGSDPIFQELNVPSGTTSATFQIYDTLTIPADTLDPAGQYRLGVCWSMRITGGLDDGEARLDLNGTPFELVRPQSVLGAGDFLYYKARTFLGSLNIATPVVVELFFRRTAGGGTVFVDNDFFEVWRVG